jgi:hypothetical protein
MPGLSGVDLAIQIKARHPKCKILKHSVEYRAQLTGSSSQFTPRHRRIHRFVRPGSLHTRQRLRHLDARCNHPVTGDLSLIGAAMGGQPGKGYRSGLLYGQMYMTEHAL